MGRNLRNLYRASKLEFNSDNIFQLKKDVDAIKIDVTELEETVGTLNTSLTSLRADFNLLKELVKATVSFDSDGGSAVESQQVAFGHTATEPEDPTKAGNRFMGWFYDDVLFDFATAIKEDRELEAQWSATYTVTYSANEGSGTPPTQSACISGETFTVASGEGLTKESKVFGGWNDGTNDYQPGDTYTVGTANVTLSAIWNDPE